MTCPSCGTEAGSGKFCGACGAALASRPCGTCGRPVGVGARFCQQCGAPVSGAGSATPASGATGPNRSFLFGAAGLLALLVVAALFWVARGANTPPAAAAPAAAAPGGPMPSAAELAAMSPTERFNRLYNRVMTAAENGDTQTMETFSSMALLAYAQLDTVDADARYHAALLRVHTGDTGGALALADSIEAESPTHLFGPVVRAMVARFGGDQPGLKAAETRFLRNWDAEMAAGRREYGEHRAMLDEFRQRAASGS
jgi:Double zinc ribbon